MKITLSQLVIAMIFSGLSLAGTSRAQGVLNRKVDISADHMDAKSFFDEISKKTGVKFIYLKESLDNQKQVSYTSHQQELKTLLETLLKPLDLSYEVVNDRIILTKNTFPNIAVEPGKTIDEEPAVANVTITGKVTDVNGVGLPGVTVRVKGTGVAAATDNQGNYTIIAPDYSATLLFTYLGYTAREVSANGQKIVNIQLTEENKALNEVVVVGYGSQKKVNVVGSVATATAADIDNRPISTGSQVLSGLVSGIQVQQGGGRPGGDGAGIVIRGVGTFSSAGTAPLILQDGLTVTSMDDVEPDNIKSISVLKDAAAAAIYGSKAANGVILIETKRGQNGKMQINYNSYYGWQNAAALPQYVNSTTYASLTGQTAAVVASYQSGSDLDNYPNVYHLNNLLHSGDGFQTNQNASFSGGNDVNSYLFSADYKTQNGITAKTNNKDYNFLFNFDSKLKDNLVLNVNMTGFSKLAVQPNSSSGQIQTIIGYAAREPNTYAGLKSNGDFGHQDAYSPEGWLNSASFYNFGQKDFLGGVKLTWTILKGLSISGQAGYKYYNNETKSYVANVQFDANTAIGPNNLNQVDADGYYLTLNSIIRYNKTYKKHNFSVLVGYEQQQGFDENFSAYRDNFPNNSLYQLSAGATTNQQNSGGATENDLQSYFGRVDYTFADKYLLEFNAREDGSSHFAPENRFGFFPSVAVGWKISEESFIKNNFSWIDLLKLRASSGSLGNQNTPTYPYQSAIALGQNYNFGGVIASGASVNTLANRDIRWETTKSNDIGLDFDLFKGKIDGSVELYNKTTTGILYTATVSGVLGLGAPTINAGSVRNNGFEANIRYNQRVGKVSFSIAPNFSYDAQRVTQISGNLQQNIGSGLFVGQPIGAYYGYVADGIFTSAADVASYPTQPIAGKPGVIRFKDLNGDGKVDATNDRTIIGHSNPKFSYGVTINASYYGFDFSALLQGLGGFSEPMNYYNLFAYYNGGNIQQWQADNSWTPANPDPNAKYPQITNLSSGSENVQLSSFFLKSGTFLRLKNVQIGYTFPNDMMKKAGIGKLRIFVGGQNLFSWNNFYPGFDPEIRQNYNDAPNFYPITKMYTFGLNVKF